MDCCYCPVLANVKSGLQASRQQRSQRWRLCAHPALACHRVYHRLESLSTTDDEVAVSREFLDILGRDKLPWLQLVHQLIIVEENMMAGNV